MQSNISSSFSEYRSTGNAVNTTVTTDTLPGDFTIRPHVFIGVIFTDANGTATTPGAGTYTVTVETVNNPGVFQAITNGTSIDATATLGTLSVAANVTRVRVVSTGITTATLFNLKLVANVS